MFVCRAKDIKKRDIVDAGQLSLARRFAGGRGSFRKISGIGRNHAFRHSPKKDDRAGVPMIIMDRAEAVVR